MQVWKFGGTSVGKPERMHSIRNLITEDSGRKIVSSKLPNKRFN